MPSSREEWGARRSCALERWPPLRDGLFITRLYFDQSGLLNWSLVSSNRGSPASSVLAISSSAARNSFRLSDCAPFANGALKMPFPHEELYGTMACIWQSEESI